MVKAIGAPDQVGMRDQQRVRQSWRQSPTFRLKFRFKSFAIVNPCVRCNPDAVVKRCGLAQGVHVLEKVQGRMSKTDATLRIGPLMIRTAKRHRVGQLLNEPLIHWLTGLGVNCNEATHLRYPIKRKECRRA